MKTIKLHIESSLTPWRKYNNETEKSYKIFGMHLAWHVLNMLYTRAAKNTPHFTPPPQTNTTTNKYTVWFIHSFNYRLLQTTEECSKDQLGKINIHWRKMALKRGG